MKFGLEIERKRIGKRIREKLDELMNGNEDSDYY